MQKLTLKISLPLLALALAGCGSLEGRRTSPKKTVQGISTGTNANSDPVLDTLAADCASRGGRLAKAGQVCMTKQTVALPPFASLPRDANNNVQSQFVVDPNFTSGKFVVATGNTGAGQGAVDLTFANRAYLKIPARVMADFQVQPQSGALAIYVNSGSYSDVVVTVWTCYERNINNRIYCSAEYIP